MGKLLGNRGSGAGCHSQLTGPLLRQVATVQHGYSPPVSSRDIFLRRILHQKHPQCSICTSRVPILSLTRHEEIRHIRGECA